MYDYYWTGSGQIPFSYGLAYFRKIVDNITEEDELTPELYRQIIANVIKKGGDTGSNACIVGGILGSIFGFKRLPN